MIRLVFLAMAHAALPMLGVLSREGRWTWTDAVVTKENWRPEMRKMRLCLEDSFGQIVSFFEINRGVTPLLHKLIKKESLQAI